MTAPEIAALAHEGQFRNDGVTPYIKHPEEVASHFEKEGFEWDTAWLHDVIEDSDITAQNLKDYGIHDIVIAAVVLLTHEKNQPYPEYIKALANGDMWASEMARSVKTIDIAVNLGDSPSKRQVKKYAEALKVLHSLA